MRTSAGYRVDVIAPCPECGMTGVPLLFGLPVQEARDAAAHGQLALGGCLVPDEEAPNWQCPREHRWRDADTKAWDNRLLEVLGTYGYSARSQ